MDRRGFLGRIVGASAAAITAQRVLDVAPTEPEETLKPVGGPNFVVVKTDFPETAYRVGDVLYVQQDGLVRKAKRGEIPLLEVSDLIDNCHLRARWRFSMPKRG